MNADLYKYGTQEQLAGLPIVFDYALITTPEVNAAGFIGAMVNATFYDPLVTAVDPFKPVSIPDRDVHGKDFQAFLTDYTVNTFLFSAF